MDSGLVTSAAGGEPPELRPRYERFGRYFLVDRIATGGMAEVYRAVTQGAEGFRRTFVVKRILAEKASSPSFIRMFCDEARICAALHHPNIVQVYDFGHVGGSYFLAMEYLPGKDLSSLMRVLRAAKAAVPPGLVAYIGREAASGLHYAHTLRGAGGKSLGIVHRDVTPSNIMLLYAGGVKLLDFGIAKAATAAGAAGEGEGVKGKFGYLAPEQARGGEIDGRADVFALGVTMWEMLVGRRLFAGKDEMETLRNVLQKPVPPPSALRPGLPPALDRVVLRALDRSPEKRYQSADELARDCDAVLGELRADNQTLRAFLNDLFAEESSSLSLDVPELPEELLADPAPAPSDSAVPRDESLEIELVEPSGPEGRTRTPAPPFGVIAADDALLVPRSAWLRGRARLVGAAALVAAVLVSLGIARAHRRGPDAPALAATPAPVVAPAPEPAAAPAPAPAAAPSPGPVAAAPVPEVPAAKPADGADAEKGEHKSRGHHRARARELSADLTLNPF
jgi:serine/threonine-protein kinase